MISLVTTQNELKTLKTAYNGAGDATVDLCKILGTEPPARSTANFIEVALKALLPNLNAELKAGREAIRRLPDTIKEKAK